MNFELGILDLGFGVWDFVGVWYLFGFWIYLGFGNPYLSLSYQRNSKLEQK